jgi:hypothetical protein
MGNRSTARIPRFRIVGSAITACFGGFLAIVSLTTAESGCGSDCGGGCTVSSNASFAVSCFPSDLQSVTVTGPCARTLPGAPLNGGPYINVPCAAEGTSHFVLQFASGFTFERDVTFTKESQGCAGCAPYFVPSELPIIVNNPRASTCTSPDAGNDSGDSSGPLVVGSE